jgi:hypothetical protein
VVTIDGGDKEKFTGTEMRADTACPTAETTRWLDKRLGTVDVVTNGCGSMLSPTGIEVRVGVACSAIGTTCGSVKQLCTGTAVAMAVAVSGWGYSKNPLCRYERLAPLQVSGVAIDVGEIWVGEAREEEKLGIDGGYGPPKAPKLPSPPVLQWPLSVY